MSENSKLTPISILAWLGDAVYELEVRRFLAQQNAGKVGNLNRLAVPLVCSGGQAQITRYLLDENDPAQLDENEREVLRRGRNYHSHNIAKHASVTDYRLATAYEALLGYLFLEKRADRLKELIHIGFKYLQEIQFTPKDTREI